mgnify:CR=1 FL=1
MSVVNWQVPELPRRVLLLLLPEGVGDGFVARVDYKLTTFHHVSEVLDY